MSHNAYVRSGGVWNTGIIVTHQEFAAFDLAQFQSINGDLGGTWNPVSPITIGGGGMFIAAGFEAVADVVIGTTSSNFLNVNSTANFAAPANFSAQANFLSTSAFTGAATFSSTITVSGIATFNGNVFTNGFFSNVTVASFNAAAFAGVVGFAGVVTANGLVNVNGQLTTNNLLNIEGGGNLQSQLVAGGAGRVTKRITFVATTGANSSAYGPVNADVVYVAALSADVTFTINATGVSDGDEIRFVTKSVTHFLTIADPTTGTQIALKNTSGQSWSALLMFFGGSFSAISFDNV